MTTLLPEDDFDIIFVRSIRLKNGRTIFASQYGKKAFPIRVRRNGQPRLPGI
ncbi:MAG: hypothetical protein RJA87_2603 [Pseudomonadota bacterium]|jgi:hypothetical protein